MVLKSFPVLADTESIMARLRLIFGLLFILNLSPLFAETSYIVVKGDTVYGIAKKFDVGVEEIIALNDIKDPGKLWVGKSLLIPDKTMTLSHLVLKGETLFGISRRYGVSVDALRTANDLAPDATLREGALLSIPKQAALDSASLDVVPKEDGAEALPDKDGADTKTGTPSIKEAVLATPIDGTAESEQVPNTTLSSSPLASGIKSSADLRPISSKTADLSLDWPIKAKEIAYLEGKLYGVWMLGELREPVIAIKAGTVAAAGPYRGFGQVVIVKSNDGLAYVYGGCESLDVIAGDRVAFGSKLGKLGLDQLSGDPRLFFFVYDNNIAVDPADAPRDF